MGPIPQGVVPTQPVVASLPPQFTVTDWSLSGVDRSGPRRWVPHQIPTALRVDPVHHTRPMIEEVNTDSRDGGPTRPIIDL